MRLGLLLYGSLDTVSGGFLYDRMLVQYLRRQGEEVEVLYLPWRAYGRGLLDNFSVGLYRRLRGAAFDLLIQDELAHPSCLWLNRRLRRNRPYPIISLVHHLRASEPWPPWQQRLYRLVERQYLATVDGLVCTSRSSLKTVTALTGPGKPGVVAHPGRDHLPVRVTPAEIAARALAPGPLEIISVGNLIPRKGLHVLLAALTRLPAQAWRLTVVGSLSMDPAYAQAIRRQREEAGWGRQVTLLGPLVKEDLAQRLFLSHLLALPSFHEGFGIVYLEGLGFGLPALATTAGGAGEIVRHGREGFLVAPGDAAALAGYLEQLAADRRLLLALSLAARERYLAHPTWAEGGARIHRFLRGFVA